MIDSFKSNINNIDRIDIIGGWDNSQAEFWFPITFIYVMDNEEIFERTAKFGYIHCRIENSIILKNIIIMKLGNSFKKYYIFFIQQSKYSYKEFLCTKWSYRFGYSCGKKIFFSKIVH